MKSASILAIRANVAADLRQSQLRIDRLIGQLRAEITERVTLEITSRIVGVIGIDHPDPRPVLVDAGVAGDDAAQAVA